MTGPLAARQTELRPTGVLPVLEGAATHQDSSAAAVTVVICAYTEARWADTVSAVQSVLEQQPAPGQLVLVVDHNPSLAARARRELPATVSVIDSDGSPGLSGARNTGLRAAAFGITAFLDDDAAARPGWLANLVAPYADAHVVATGGSVYPRWPIARPPWLPPEFDWVVGCSYRGLPESLDVVRNPIGANMSMRTGLALSLGGFDSAIGRTASKPRGCEETELAIRLTNQQAGSVIMYVPDAPVDHHVAADRIKLAYLMRRCWHEGRSKAKVVRSVGSDRGLARERRHLASVIPTGILRDLRAAVTGDAHGLQRVAVTALGIFATAAGYIIGRCELNQRRVGQPAAD
jgi:hypothetical protein